MVIDGQLKVSGLLWRAIPLDMRYVSTDQSRHMVVLAAYLDSLAETFGCSEEHEAEFVARALGAKGLRPFVEHYLRLDSKPIDAEDIRDKLYAVFAHLANAPHVGRCEGATKSEMSAERVFMTAQVYWALSHHSKTRPALELRQGPNFPRRNRRGDQSEYKTIIWVDAADVDLAVLKRSVRANTMQGMELTSGGALRAQAARLAVRAATYLVDGITESRPSLEGFSFVHQPTKDGDVRVTAIEWDTKTQGPSRNQVLVTGHSQSTSDDPDVDVLRQMRAGAASAGRHSEVTLYCDFITKLIEERFHADPIDREARLAEESLRSGILWAETGQFDEAIQSLTKAERASHTLAELRPAETIHTFSRSAALTMLGVLYTRTGRSEDAHQVLADAVVIAQRLTDEDSGNEGLLATALSMLGIHLVQAESLPKAAEVLARTVTISEKLVRQTPLDHSYGLLYANALLSLGSVHLQLEDWEKAEKRLAQAIVAAEKISSYQQIWPVQLTLSGALLNFGMLFLMTDRPKEAELMLASAVTKAQEVFESTSDWTYPGIDLSLFSKLAGSAELLLGMVYLTGEQTSAAERHFQACISSLGSLPLDVEAETMTADAFEFLAEIYEDQGRIEEAESARSGRFHLGS